MDKLCMFNRFFQMTICAHYFSVIMLYAVVVFEDVRDVPEDQKEEMVEAVPKCWVSGDKCFWPNLTGAALSKAREQCMPPAPGWTTCQNVKIVKETGDVVMYTTFLNGIMF